MKNLKILLCAVFSLVMLSAHTQPGIIFFENFNDNNHAFELNTDSTSGDNQWIINSNYDGNGIYPNTTPQDSTNIGVINNSPYSKYLHIHDAEAASQQNVANTNYNPASASEAFVEMKEGICTKSLENVELQFYYLCKGNDSAYAQLYYQKDGGSWQLASNEKFKSTTQWKLRTVSNVTFNDAEELKFGFKWTNAAGNQSGNTAFAVDDILVSTYNNPTIEIGATILQDTACRGRRVTVEMALSSTMCEGLYRFELSAPNGNFQHPTNLGTLTWEPSFPDTSNIVAPIPNSMVDTGVCYRIRIIRLTPSPYIVGTPTNCFYLTDCPPAIETLQPSVTIGAEYAMEYALCVGSAINIPFRSYGTLNPANLYEAYIGNQLDTINDTTFILKNPKKIGTKPDDSEFNPQPGIVSGAVPTSLEEGCQYYIQVKSTSPEAYGNLYGPFCIRKCDITTNNNKDIVACITDTSGYEEELNLEVNSWNDSIDYLPGNSFEIQILDNNTFSVINTGGLGTVTDTNANSIMLDVPPYPALQSMGIVPGDYFLRVIATNSTAAYDTMGTLIDLSIGYTGSPPTVNAYDTVACLNNIVQFEVTPYNNQSSYQWQLGPNVINGDGSPYFSVKANALGNFEVRAREVNYGCVGSWSDWETVSVVEEPDAFFYRRNKPCIGEEITFSAIAQEHTSYNWNVGNNGTIVEDDGDEIKVIFDSIGQFSVSLNVTNPCGTDDYSVNVQVTDSTFITGVVWTHDLNDLTNSAVLLLDYVPMDSSLKIVDTFVTSMSGEFLMDLKQPDKYVKVIPDHSNYPNQMPTYYNSTLTWDNAEVVSNRDCGIDTVLFNTIQGSNPGGPGFVSGKVTKGSGKNAQSGKPLVGMSVILQDKQGNPVTYGITDENGWFEIENVPLGEFALIGDWPYLNNDQAPTLELTAGSSEKDSLSVKMVNRTLEVGKLTGGVSGDTYPGKVEVYPQPADKALYINLGDRAPQDVHYSLIDMLGREVRSGSLLDAATILDVAELRGGVYLLQLVQGEIITTQKIVIQ